MRVRAHRVAAGGGVVADRMSDRIGDRTSGVHHAAADQRHLGALTLGLAGPAIAAPNYVTPRHDAVYSTHSDSATIRPVDCSVHVNYQGSDVDVNWC